MNNSSFQNLAHLSGTKCRLGACSSVAGVVPSFLAAFLGFLINECVLTNVQAELCYQALEVVKVRTW